ncbi:MAG: monomeric [FeFe] hydrogenase [Candidatus Gastranaerophilales bacterium]|nr:monomeric [FeFe] hydrogenase [Candidatus Gastranaerophilales bacterium]
MSNGQTIEIKNEILERIVEAFFSDNYEENTRLIPYDMRPKGSEVPYRCCVYKERAILKERVKAGLGFSLEDDDETKLLSTYAKEAFERTQPEEDTLTVLDAACVGCVPSRIYVTDLCQGCVARPCQSACKFGAISMVDGKSKIDGSKCKNCKMCMRACPYNAIVKLAVPCEDACPVGAINKDGNNITRIDFDRCITCGKCVAACPFGAVNEKSQIIDIMKNIKNPNKRVVAMIAPSIAGQFNCSIYKLNAAMKKAGFDVVVEVAQGADITTINEAKEFEERMEEGAPFMTTSCCAGYNNLTAKHLTDIQEFKSTTGTPLYYTAQIVREKYPDAISVFVSPCVAKRKEGMNNDNVDYVLNYQELKALLKGRKIDIEACEEMKFDVESSKQARNFGVIGGVADAVHSVLKDKDSVKPYIVDGLTKDSIKELKKFAKDKNCPGCNLIEVMCCEGGCIGGNATVATERDAKKQLKTLLDSSSDLERKD